MSDLEHWRYDPDGTKRLISSSRTKSSRAEMASALIQTYSALQLRAQKRLNKQQLGELQQLNSTSRDLLGEAKSHTQLQSQIEQNTKAALQVAKEQAEVSKSQLAETTKQTQLMEMENKRCRLRDEAADLRREQKDAEKAYFKQLRNAVHLLNKQALNASQSDFTNVEAILYFRDLHLGLAHISADDFDEFSDKEYFDRTENLILGGIREREEGLSEVEKSDLAKIIDIEAVDENDHIDLLMMRISDLLEVRTKIQKIEKEIKNKQRVSDEKFDAFKSEINILEQQLSSSMKGYQELRSNR